MENHKLKQSQINFKKETNVKSPLTWFSFEGAVDCRRFSAALRIVVPAAPPIGTVTYTFINRVRVPAVNELWLLCSGLGEVSGSTWGIESADGAVLGHGETQKQNAAEATRI